MDKIIELKPIKESTSDYEEIEKKIKILFKKEIYFPLLALLKTPRTALKNSLNDLAFEIQQGNVVYSDGRFSGKFNASLSKDLRALGAKWDRATSSYKVTQSDLPPEINMAISTSRVRYEEKMAEIDNKLSRILPEDVAANLKISSQFDSVLWKVEKEFKKNVEHITIAPQLSDEQREKVAKEWENNIQLYIQKFTEEQIVSLRKMVQENAFKGIRREALHTPIQEILLGINSNWKNVQSKAKFLARQETNLLMAKYKETKYVAAGVKQYKWGCVKMPHQSSPNAPYLPGEVRYGHGVLEGKIFSWDDPPITTAPGQSQRRNNPGQDYNCRCFAIPIVRFSSKS